MEDQIELNKVLNTYEDLKEIAQFYYNWITLDNIKTVKSPSLKYGFYNMNLLNAFLERINIMNTDIEKLKESLKHYSGNKVDVSEETKKLDEISNKLNLFEKESFDEYDFNKIYLVTVAKNYDILKTDIAKNIFIKSSEDKINSRIKYYLKCEKSFLIFNDIIKQFKMFFNY